MPDPMVLRNGKWTMWAGDLSGGNYISNTDVSQTGNAFLNGLHMGVYHVTDMNMNGYIDNTEFSSIESVFRQGLYSSVMYFEQ
jgi:hypothetical protein